MTSVAPARPRTVIVCTPAAQETTWLTVAALLDWLTGSPIGPLVDRYPIRRRPIIGWFTQFTTTHLIEATRRRGSTRTAAGGIVGRLDLAGLAQRTRDEASARWQLWHHHIAARTPLARTWADFQAQVATDPKLTVAEARRRFEAQPRVQQMLAYNVHPINNVDLDPDELDIYQAGEAVYTTRHWMGALAGDALITTTGQILRPASDACADVLRYLKEASAHINRLHRTDHMVAVRVDKL